MVLRDEQEVFNLLVLSPKGRTKLCIFCGEKHINIGSHLRSKHGEEAVESYLTKLLYKAESPTCENPKCNQSVPFTGRLDRGFPRHCSSTCAYDSERFRDGQSEIMKSRWRDAKRTQTSVA